MGRRRRHLPEIRWAGPDERILSVTPRQKDYIDFIERYWKKKGYGPSEQDVADHFLVSAPSAHLMIARLVSGGALWRDNGVPRSVRPPWICVKATKTPGGRLVLGTSF